MNASTQAHINEVQRLLRLFATELLKRGEQHDRSKHSPEEAPIFEEFTARLKGLTYGSPEYKDCLKQMQPALDHHYMVNRHHPEHFPDGIDGMNLIDIVEMFLDWYAASKRHDNGDIFKSIDLNFTRFEMSVQLRMLLRNTAEFLTQDMDHSCGNCSSRNFGNETQGQCRASSTVVLNTDGEGCTCFRSTYPKS